MTPPRRSFVERGRRLVEIWAGNGEAPARLRAVQPLTALIAAAALSAAPAAAASAAAGEPPRLLLLIVVDQLGEDLLDRHEQHLTGGFRRLLDDGRRFTRAEVAHAPTNSLPGHLTAASGAHPSRHGIIDNGWVEWANGAPQRITGFSDPCPIVTSDGVEYPAVPGIGPGRFEAPTIVEWVLAVNPKARFASVGTGGGVSALHAGKAKGPVLWFSTSVGEYVSSTCYAPELPTWAAAFNEGLARNHMSADWTLAAPPAMLAGLRPDAAPFEHKGNDFTFPHRRPDRAAALPEWFNFTPFIDRATLDLAVAAIENESLGADAITDILTLGLSSLDHVGHASAPTASSRPTRCSGSTMSWVPSSPISMNGSARIDGRSRSPPIMARRRRQRTRPGSESRAPGASAKPKPLPRLTGSPPRRMAPPIALSARRGRSRPPKAWTSSPGH